jgi:hypothetical protein
MVHGYNPSYLEVQTGGLQITSQPGQKITRPSIKNKIKSKRLDV